MKVVMVHSRYAAGAPSGENRVVDTETAALRRAGHTVVPFERASDDIGGWSALRKARIPLEVVWNRAARRDLAAVLRRERPDVVHVHNTFPLISPSVLASCRDAGTPMVVSLHNSRLLCARGDFFRGGEPCHQCIGSLGGPALKHRCYRGSLLATLPLVATIDLHREAWRSVPAAYIFVSESHRRASAEAGLPADRCFVKWNMVPPPVSAPPRRAAPVVSYVGRLDEAKGVRLLKEAWGAYRAGHPRAGLRLAIAGDGPLAPMVQEWSKASDDVDYLGLLDRTACLALLARSRAVIVPSMVRETFGLIVPEAMSVGVPAVVAGHGALPELVVDGVDGVVFRPADAGDLARVLDDIDRRPDRWDALGRSAGRAFADRFDPASNLDQLLGIYRFAMAHPTGNPAGPRDLVDRRTLHDAVGAERR